VEYRWTQGRAQTLELITSLLFDPRTVLLDREKAAAENALSRNV
jgi:hypothetical protein